jgi:hypothetical protein
MEADGAASDVEGGEASVHTQQAQSHVHAVERRGRLDRKRAGVRKQDEVRLAALLLRREHLVPGLAGQLAQVGGMHALALDRHRSLPSP